jgi:hypothetical protein
MPLLWSEARRTPLEFARVNGVLRYKIHFFRGWIVFPVGCMVDLLTDIKGLLKLRVKVRA